MGELREKGGGSGPKAEGRHRRVAWWAIKGVEGNEASVRRWDLTMRGVSMGLEGHRIVSVVGIVACRRY
jgi:hypothetical protein